MYDVIVVGARCAGSSTAMLLARRGYRVLVVDRATFPSDTMSTHYVKRPAIAQLKRWGLLDQVIASNCPPIRTIRFDLGPFTLVGEPLPPVGLALGEAADYAPRRAVLDKILVDAAGQAGATVEEGFPVDELLWENGRVVGIRGRAASGARVDERAQLVVGADGRRSFVAQAVDAPAYNERPSLTTSYYTYWSDVPIGDVEMYPRDGHMIIAFPTNDGLTCTFVQWPQHAFHRVRADLDASFHDAFNLAPGLAARIGAGRRAERFVGTADLPNFFRKPFGPGWALVGDAGYHRDPIIAQGITDALRDAELLSEAIHAGLSLACPLDQALAEYEASRNAAALPLYELTCQLASLEPPPPPMQQLFGALLGNPVQTNRFFGALVGTVPVQDFFAPDNLREIVAGAAAVA
jgi:2-polyprenyl-6-methoxyphenol hydroxylase-like FAD-dependent oxidoreductase